MKTPLNIKIQRIIPRDEFKSFVEKKSNQKVYIILVYTGTSFQTGPPQIRHKSQLLSIRFPLSLYPQQSAVLPETPSEWRKKLLRPRSSRLRTIVPTRKYVLSSLSLVASTVFFSPTCERLASFHGLYLSSRIISFVSLLRQPFPNRTTTSNPSYLPYRQEGREGSEAKFNRGNFSRNCSFVPFPIPRSKTPQPRRSIESRTRSSYFCIHVLQFHEIPSSDFAVHLHPSLVFLVDFDQFLLC